MDRRTGNIDSDKAVLVVSFGTSVPEAERSCIRPVEDAIRRAFPDWETRRAFTSRIIVRRMRARGEAVDSETEALERLRADGFERIVVAPTHIIPGEEYGRVCAAAAGRAVSGPLLADDGDLEWMAGVLAGIAREENRPLLMMGHGTEHAADGIYARLRERLPDNVLLACVEGAHSLETVLPLLDRLPGRRLTLAPLMLVAGDHARNDMAGDGEDSWKSVLTARGFDVRVRLQGLGALECVQRWFVEKVRRAME